MTTPKEGWNSGIERIVPGVVDADGNWTASSPLGGEVITIGSGGLYSTVADYVSFLSTADVVTPISLDATYTATINDGERIVTLSPSPSFNALPNAVLSANDAWSPDGVTWYRINALTEADSFELRTPYSGSNLSGATLYLGTPIWRNVVMSAGDYTGDATQLLDFSSLSASFINVQGIALPRIGVPGGGTYSVSPPDSGVLSVNGFDIGGNGYTIPFRAIASVAEVFLDNVIGVTKGVDIAIGTCGEFRAFNCVFKSANDGITLATNGEPCRFVSCRLEVGGDLPLFAIPFWFPVRLFFGTTRAQCYGCRLIATTINRSPNPGKEAYIVDSGQEVVVEMNGCEIEVSGYTGSTTAVVGTFTAGTNMKAVVKLRNCTINGTATSGTPTIIEAQTWAASTGGVEIHWCDLNGLAVGGGGDQPASQNYNLA